MSYWMWHIIRISMNMAEGGTSKSEFWNTGNMSYNALKKKRKKHIQRKPTKTNRNTTGRNQTQQKVTINNR